MSLKYQTGKEVHDGADGSKVVERNQGIHLELGRAEQSLYHDQSDGLEHDSTTLEDESNHDKFDLAKGCEDDANDDEGYIEKHLEIGLGNSQTPAGKENGNGSSGL